MQHTLIFAIISALGGSLFLQGCIAAPAGSPAVTTTTNAAPVSAAATAASANKNAVRMVGLLTRKGPELGAWWALTDAAGKVWQLDTANGELAEEFMQWQNRQVEVQGVPNGMSLSVPRLWVHRAQLKAN